MNYQIIVKTGTSQEKVVIDADDKLVAYLRAKPHDGEANTALIKLLAKHFKVAKSRIQILRGAKSHQKVIKIN